MLYNLKNPIDKQKAVARFKSLISKDCVIELKEKQNRTIRQNNYLHLILTWFSLEYGCSMEYAKHSYFKEMNKNIFEETKTSKKSGKEFTQFRSSRDLDSAEMTICIDKFRNWSGQNGIYLPEANEHEFLKEIQIQESKNRY